MLDYLVERYGDFVLLRPPFKPQTYLLWFGPFVLLVLAALLLMRSIRRQQDTVVDDISDEERERLDTILGNKTSSQGKDQ